MMQIRIVYSLQLSTFNTDFNPKLVKDCLDFLIDTILFMSDFHFVMFSIKLVNLRRWVDLLCDIKIRKYFKTNRIIN